MVIELTVSDAHLTREDIAAYLRIDNQGVHPSIEMWFEGKEPSENDPIMFLDEVNIIRIIDTLKDILNEMKKENK